MSNTTSDLTTLIKRVCKRLNELVSDLINVTRLADDESKTLLLWRMLLLTLSADIGASLAWLAKEHNSDHSRAMRILNRSLFEYGVRLEFYIFYPEQAVRHAKNVRTWWGRLLKANKPFIEEATLTDAERDQIADVIKNMGELEYPALRYMLYQCLKHNGYRSGERKRRLTWLLESYYHIGSALVHGSQGAFYDFFAKNPETGNIEFTSRSVRHSGEEALRDAAINLIGMISSEEKHRDKYLASDMFYRDLEFATGIWEYVRTTNPRLT